MDHSLRHRELAAALARERVREARTAPPTPPNRPRVLSPSAPTPRGERSERRRGLAHSCESPKATTCMFKQLERRPCLLLHAAHTLWSSVIQPDTGRGARDHMDRYLEINRASWDERAAAHAASNSTACTGSSRTPTSSAMSFASTSRGSETSAASAESTCSATLARTRSRWRGWAPA